jgi:alpha-L-fucosidase
MDMIKKFPLSYSLCTFLVLISASQLIKAQTKVDPFGMGPHTTLDVVLAAAKAPSSLAVGPTEASWESIRSTYQIPAWFMDAKFGIFIHWGLFSIPAHHNEWYEKHMYMGAEDTRWHVEHYGALNTFGYKDFIPLFKADHFNANNWAALFKASGARYVMLPGEHHDGFSLWNSTVNPWNSTRLGPKRDLIGELAIAMQKEDLHYGIANHSIEHYTFTSAPKDGTPTDLNDPKYKSFYWTEHNPENLKLFFEQWVLKNEELIDLYHPDMLWFDNGINARVYDPIKLKVAAYYYNRSRSWNKSVSIVTKSNAYLSGSIVDHERLMRAPQTLQKTPWQVHDTLGSTWGYTEGMHIASAAGIIRTLVEVISKNGCYMLNVSPKGDGSIPEDQQKVLHQIGSWLAVNAEAVYGSRTWKISGEGRLIIPRGQTPTGKDIRFTQKDGYVYAFSLAWPGTSALISSLAQSPTSGTIMKVELLGSPAKIPFLHDTTGLHLTLPEQKPDESVFVFKISGLNLN